MGKDVQRCGLRTTIKGFDADTKVLARGLRILDKNVEVAVLVEHACFQKLKLKSTAAPFSILIQKPLVGERSLWVFIEVLHVGVGGSAVDVEVVLLHILAVVALAGSEAEGALFQDGILPVPESKTEHQELIPVANRSQPVFTPAVSLAASHVVRKEIPRRSIRAVVLANSAPGAFTDIGAPPAPSERL